MIDEQFIRRCLELASKGKGNVAPNPMVGAVLVHDGKIIGEGWHKEYGGNHAEVNCIESVHEDFRHLIPDSKMYVSLEPCSHYGKTPPCANRILEEKIKHVIICNDDPFEKVAGNGFEVLTSNGVEVAKNILVDDGKWLNRRFFCFHEKKRPYIILKWAQSKDGFIAPEERSRKQLSNKHSMQLVHKWRTEEAAILVGYNTALNDNPELTARNYKGKQPLRLVLDRKLALPNTHNIFNAQAPTWVINMIKDEVYKNLSYIKIYFGESLLKNLLEKLHRFNIQSLIVEGGAATLESFISQGLWDEARVFSTDVILQNGIPAPRLRNADNVFTTSLELDQLDVYTNKENAYTFVTGLEL